MYGHKHAFLLSMTACFAVERWLPLIANEDQAEHRKGVWYQSASAAQGGHGSRKNR
jgi:hypothetical protein